MTSMNNGPDFFLEVLCLGIYSTTEETKRLTNAVLEVYDEESVTDSQMKDPRTQLYINILREINSSDVDLTNKAEMAACILKFKHSPAVDKDPEILDTIKQIFSDREFITQRRITNMQKSIRNWVLWVKGNSALRKMFGMSQQCSATTNKIKQDLLLNEILSHARELTKTYESDALMESSTIDFIDMSCKQSVRKGLTSYQDRRNNKAWKSGLQGINRMFGSLGGLAPGEFVGYAALSHHYKSGILMDWARWIATYNTPGTMHGKIPIIVFFSLENEVYQNMMAWFRAAYANAFKQSCEHLSNDEVIDYVTEVYSKNGFRLLVFREMGEIFSYEDYISKIEQLRSQNYHIIASIIDYITLMSTGNVMGMNDAKKIQILCNKIGNYGNHHGMTTVTGLQLGTLAEELAASGVTNVVKRYGAAHLADCKGAKREFDVLIFMHKEINHLGIPYLTMKLDKHRYVNDTPPKDRYCAYPFTEMGIMDDINGEDRSVKDIYSDGDAVQEKAEATGGLF